MDHRELILGAFAAVADYLFREAREWLERRSARKPRTF